MRCRLRRSSGRGGRGSRIRGRSRVLSSSPRNPVAKHQGRRRAVVVVLVVERPRRVIRVHRHLVVLRRRPEMQARGRSERFLDVDVRELAGADRQKRRPITFWMSTGGAATTPLGPAWNGTPLSHATRGQSGATFWIVWFTVFQIAPFRYM